MRLDVSDQSNSNELEGNFIEDGHYGDIVVRYYDGKGTEAEGFICDYQWDTDDANKFCEQKW